MLLFPIEIRSDFETFNTASLTDEQRLEIGEPNMIWPSNGTDRYRVAAFIIRAIDQQAAMPISRIPPRKIYCGRFID